MAKRITPLPLSAAGVWHCKVTFAGGVQVPALKILLPLPPSVNAIWRIASKSYPAGIGGGKVMLARTALYQRWRSASKRVLLDFRRPYVLESSLAALLFPVFGQNAGDADNRVKAFFDVLEAGEIIKNDRLIKWFCVEKRVLPGRSFMLGYIMRYEDFAPVNNCALTPEFFNKLVEGVTWN